MFWFIVIVVILIVVSAISGAAQKAEEAQKRQEFTTLAQSRVSAYADFLKRTSQSPETAGMTDNEVRDFIQKNIREYATERKGAEGIAAFIIIGGIVGGIIVAVVNQSFGPLIFIGGVAFAIAMFFYKTTGESLERKYRQRGLDVHQLKIDN